MEVVVMPFSGSFIQSPERWMGYPFQPPLINENLQIPIDRRLVERFHKLAAICKNLIHPQRSFVLAKDLFYGGSLCCVAPQGLILLIFKEFRVFPLLLQALSQ
jgi:hypothetical protein